MRKLAAVLSFWGDDKVCAESFACIYIFQDICLLLVADITFLSFSIHFNYEKKSEQKIMINLN